MKFTFNQAKMRKQHILLFTLGAGLLLSSCEEQKEEEKEEGKKFPGVRVAAAEIEDFDHWVELQGTIESPQDVQLTPVMSGNIRKIYVQEGQYVKKGQMIAIMDNDIVASNISEAQAALNNAIYNYKKQEELYTAGVGTEFNYRQAFDQKELAEKRMRTLRVQAGKAGVFAPFDGLIDEIYPSEGEVGGPQAPICHIVGLEKLTVVANVSETFINQIGEGTEVKVKLPSMDTTIKDLKINRVSKYINPKNRTYKVFIDIENEDKSIVPNLLARVQLKDGHFPNSTVVNNSAIQYDKHGNTFLFSLDKIDSSTYVSNRVAVSTLSSFGGASALENIDEINKGDMIVIEGAEGIVDQDTVTILK